MCADKAEIHEVIPEVIETCLNCLLGRCMSLGCDSITEIRAIKLPGGCEARATVAIDIDMPAMGI